MAVKVEKEGFSELEDMLSDYLKKTNDQEISNVLKTGAEEFKDDLLRLASPRSRINKGSYTHLLDTFAVKQEDVGWLVGWGKYYGPILEHGWSGAGSGKTSHHSAIKHLKPTFNSNKEKYYKDMVNKFHS